MLYCSLRALQTGQAGQGVRRFVKWGAIQCRGQRHVALIPEGCLTRSAALTPQPSDVRFLSIGASWPTGVANAGSTVNESLIVSDE